MSKLNISSESLEKQTTAFIEDEVAEIPAANEHADEEKEKAIRQYRRQLYEEFKNSITLHGYRQLSTEKGWRKVFWIIQMTLLTVFAVYLSYHMLRDFGYRTALEYEYEDGLSHLDYPTITICGFKPVYSPMSFKRFPLNITLEEFKEFYLENLSLHSKRFKTSNFSKAVFEALYAINVTSYKEIVKLFENTIEDAMDTFADTTCFQNGLICNLTTDFRETSMMLGNSLCHQWNYYDEKKVSKQQENRKRLTMYLDTHVDYQLLQGEFPSFVGLYIHPYGTPHYLREHTEVIVLQTGKHTTINIDITKRNLLPPPYSTKCDEKELSIIKKFPYSRALCEVNCILEKIYKKCKCVGFEYEGYIGDIPICNPAQMKCYYKNIEIYKDSCVHYSSTCPRECTNHHYHIQTSLEMHIPAEGWYRYAFKKDWTKDLEETKKYIKQNILGFSIGYKSLSKKVENYVPLVTPSGLIGTLGGSIGLCLGFSFVTAFEVVVFIYDYATARWKINR